MISIVFSLASLAVVSAQAFFSQHLGHQADQDPKLHATILPLVIPFTMVAVPHLLAWTLMASYLRAWVFLFAFVKLLLHFAISWGLTHARYKTGVATEMWKSFRDKMWASDLTAQFSPCVVVGSAFKVLNESGLISMGQQIAGLVAFHCRRRETPPCCIACRDSRPE